LDDLYQPPYGSVEEARKKSTKEFAYVAGQDGLYKVFRAGGDHAPLDYTIVTRVHEAPALRNIQPGFFINRIETIPKVLLARCASIFRMRYQQNKSEMILILKWDDEKKEYSLDRVKFGVAGPGYLRYYYEGEKCGTIHSHGGIHACFSRTDDGDDLNKPGIHIVMGDFDQDDVSVVSSITGAGERFKLRNSGLEDWMCTFEITEEEYAWFNQNVLDIEEVQSKSNGFYIVDKESKKVAFWTESKKEAEELIDPLFFEIEKVVKKDRQRFYQEDSKDEIEDRKAEDFKPKRDFGRSLDRSAHEAAVVGITNFILTNDLVYEFAEAFAIRAPADKVEEMVEHLEGNLNFIIDSKRVKREVEDEDENLRFDFPPRRPGLCGECLISEDCQKARDNVSVCGDHADEEEECEICGWSIPFECDGSCGEI
jgi:hypothetical protein